MQFVQYFKTHIFVTLKTEIVQMRILKCILLLNIIVGLQSMFAQGPYIPPEKPKLIVSIIVEQLRFDKLEKVRRNFGDSGINRLINEGTYYRNAKFNHLLTQGAPGYATIHTGSEPAFHGIPSDNWYDRLNNELIYCTQDNSAVSVGGSYESGRHSAATLLSTTFSDELKLSSNGASRSYSAGFREYSAIFGAGHISDGAFWFDDRTGRWMSSSYYMADLPEWVKDFNAMNYSEKYMSQVWDRFMQESYYSAALPDSGAHKRGFGDGSQFPYDLSRMSQSGFLVRKRDFTLLRETPFSNSLTTDFVLKLIEQEGLGRGKSTDYIAISYNATDLIGHRFGPSSTESVDALYRLDREVERVLKYLTDSVGKRNVLVYFTSAHGISEVPEVLEINRVPSGRFNHNQALSLLRSYLNAIYGQGDWVRGYHERQIFLNRNLIEDARIPIEEIQARVARFVVQFSGVAAAYPFSVFESGAFNSGYMKKIGNSFSPVRSGDVVIVLQPGWIENNSYAANHNSPFDYDSHVPLIWFGWSVNRASVMRSVSMTDIAPTLSAIIGIPSPNASTGSPLTEVIR